MACTTGGIGDPWPTWTSTDSSCTSYVGSTPSSVWYYWNSSSTTCNTAVAADDTWSEWVAYDQGTTSTTTSTVWVKWNQSDSYIVSTFRETKAQAAARRRRERELERQRKEAEQRAKELERKRAEAEKKANDLLLDLIGEEEFKVFQETGRIFVRGRKYDYILEKDRFVKRVEKDKIVDLCIHLENRHAYPEVDNLISLKLLAESDERRFNELANNHGSRERPAELPKCANG